MQLCAETAWPAAVAAKTGRHTGTAVRGSWGCSAGSTRTAVGPEGLQGSARVVMTQLA